MSECTQSPRRTRQNVAMMNSALLVSHDQKKKPISETGTTACYNNGTLQIGCMGMSGMECELVHESTQKYRYNS